LNIENEASITRLNVRYLIAQLENSCLITIEAWENSCIKKILSIVIKRMDFSSAG